MLNFYPGPSKLDPKIQDYFSDAVATDILAQNHRSTAFMAVIERLKLAFAEKLNLPNGYEVLLTSSATECWQIAIESCAEAESTHVFNGSFGEKWHFFADQILGKALKIPFDLQAHAPMVYGSDLICLTHNETSNGTQLSDAYISEVRRQNPDATIAIDATSSMGGVILPWQSADIWLASVQKCFGMPAGLGIVVVSEKAFEKAKFLNKAKRYNALLNIRENFLKNQTPNTPNVTGIYLLMRILEDRKNIESISIDLKNRATKSYVALSELSFARPLIADNSIRSDTVFCMDTDENIMVDIYQKAQANGILLGKGYGSQAAKTFRIANFPAIKSEEFKILLDFLKFFETN